ncbi:autotransporter outer membrane beta-barrel domain-containing protein [Dryocola clanedunensis]|uniref:autotransporter outer membrane beta-barrel domain-containing protein n=1 Tax=Cedecea sulfonylureivorans TaxID=3051154 RepID=UPI00192976E2|nr:autotransporter outer membrane beta-barrel domain-containing protein [Cedecea sulfonylureivorans]
MKMKTITLNILFIVSGASMSAQAADGCEKQTGSNDWICSGTPEAGGVQVSIGDTSGSVTFDKSFEYSFLGNAGEIEATGTGNVTLIQEKGSVITSERTNALFYYGGADSSGNLNAEFNGVVNAGVGHTYGYGLRVDNYGRGAVNIINNGEISAGNIGIQVKQVSNESDGIGITNNGSLKGAYGIIATTQDSDASLHSSDITINNTGDISASGSSIYSIKLPDGTSYALSESGGILSIAGSGAVNISNSGTITADDYGIITAGGGNTLVSNTGSIISDGAGIAVVGIDTVDSTVSNFDIQTSGNVESRTGTGIIVATQGTANVDVQGAVSGGNGTAVDVRNAQNGATLRLSENWQLTGQALASTTGTNDTLELTGAKASTLDLTRIGTDLIGFDDLVKSGDSMWTLQGKQSAGEFNRVTLQQGGLNLDNATLLTTGPVTIETPAVLSVNGTSRLSASTVNNSGTLNLANNIAGDALYIDGDYIGNGGTIALDTELNGDESATDRIAISGSTSGSTAVRVKNAGGSGAQTLNGIELISVGAASDGEFTQDGRIVAGAYDYKLVRGSGENTANWYLSSTDTTPEPTPTPDPEPEPDPTPDPQPDPTPDPKPDPTPAPAENNIRPEAAAYGANIAAANTLFSTSLHDRMGETHYVDALGQDQVTSLWMRNAGGHNRATDSSGQNKTQSNRYVIQIGGDLASLSTDGANRFHLGVMGGYANQHGNTRNQHTGYSADSSIDGYSAGFYATWFQDNVEKTGAYVDSWILYNWFDNSVSGQDNLTENYQSKGITSSVETGYTLKLTQLSARSSWYIQPQAQLTYMGVRADDHRESNGTKVISEGDGNIQSRLGVRTFLKGHHALDDGKGRTFEPFVEANWLHNTRNFGASLDEVRIDRSGTRNIGELKTGVEARVNNTVNMWASISQQMGDKGYSDTLGVLGVKANF